jgi:hypothetical protein
VAVANGGTGASSLTGAGIITTGGGQTISGTLTTTNNITSYNNITASGTVTGSYDVVAARHLFAGTSVDNPVANGRLTLNWNPNQEQGLTMKAINALPSIGNAMAFLDQNNTTVAFLYQDASGVVFINTSDYRLKNSIMPMTSALDKVTLLKPCTYKWNKDDSDGQGFIAHELQAVFKECVFGEKDALNEDGSIKPQFVDLTKLIIPLTAAIQELKALVDVQASRITALEAKVG